jgi:hypothetical protein
MLGLVQTGKQEPRDALLPGADEASVGITGRELKIATRAGVARRGTQKSKGRVKRKEPAASLCYLLL